MQIQNTLSDLVPTSRLDLRSVIPDRPNRERILVVDDSPVVRRSICNHLKAFYECIEADSVIEALERLKFSTFELVITDVIMPGLSGIELLRKVVEFYPQTAVIVVSGVDRPQRALDAVRLGAFDYLIKPCENDVLESTVRRALERRSLLINAKRYKAELEARNEELIQGKQQLERLQAQIVQNEKMASLGQLAAGVAHELNNPVAFLYGNLELLEGSVNDLLKLLHFFDTCELPEIVTTGANWIKKEIKYERTLEDLEAIITDCKSGAERVRNIVQNLKTFSRLDEADLKMADIHEGIESTIRMLSQYYAGGNIRLVRDFGEMPRFECFAGQLNQVWMNLLVNAAQAIGGRGGQVRIETRCDADNAYISISDTGGGIDPTHLSRIFDPFFTTKPVGEGTGLGLSISFGIVEKHGGRIEVDSRKGDGTRFTVVIPRNVTLTQKDEARESSNSHTKTEQQSYAI